MSHDWINVGILKGIIKDIPDDVMICFGKDDAEFHIQMVDKAELCQDESEDHDALVFSITDRFYSDSAVKTVYPVEV